MKSEDVLYEIKKIQQEEALEQGYVYEQVRRRGAKWYELKNVRYFYEFFDKNRKYFVR